MKEKYDLPMRTLIGSLLESLYGIVKLLDPLPLIGICLPPLLMLGLEFL